jgi:hypothetical protein
MLVRCRVPDGSDASGIRVVSRNYLRPSASRGGVFLLQQSDHLLTDHSLSRYTEREIYYAQ